MKNSSIFRLLILPAVLSAFLLSGCANTTERQCAAAIAATQKAVDYSSARNWVLLPEEAANDVDLFYVYPTIFVSDNEPFMNWKSPAMREKAVNISRQQTGPFAGSCNIYAPFVRQAELSRALRDLRHQPLRVTRMKPGMADTAAAFRYYLKHYNKGRPFILAGHSQGAFDLLELMKAEFGDPALQDKLVAAYLFGCPVTLAECYAYPQLKPAQGPLDLGVIVCWNTQAPGAVNSLFTGRGGICINPLNWRTDAVPAPAEANAGALFFDGENNLMSEIPAFCDAAIAPATGALEVTPKFPGQYDTLLLGPGVYHMNDIYFFYRNIEVNARDRIARYFSLKDTAE